MGFLGCRGRYPIGRASRGGAAPRLDAAPRGTEGSVSERNAVFDQPSMLWTLTNSHRPVSVLACLMNALSRIASPTSSKAISPVTPV